jgi:glycosyltransferase involved in cell wall biosynthesis
LNNVIECSLVIPIYKSEKNIPSLIAVLTDFSSRFNNSFEVVFVVDGSPDNSLEALLSSETSACFTFKIIEFSNLT